MWSRYQKRAGFRRAAPTRSSSEENPLSQLPRFRGRLIPLASRAAASDVVQDLWYSVTTRLGWVASGTRGLFTNLWRGDPPPNPPSPDIVDMGSPTASGEETGGAGSEPGQL